MRGVADRTSGLENTPQTLFSLASVGKMATAEAIDGLVRRGALSFDTPVIRILPELAPAFPDGVTVDALLQHRSGLTVANGETGDRLCGVVAAAEGRGYGRGCSVRFGGYGRRYGHTGSTAGVQARVFAYPDRGYEIVVLSNHDGEAAPVFDALEASLFGLEESPDQPG